ncbi:MAG: acyl-CoA desaturase [Candidatus Tyrphobacter sp.]
MHLISKTHWLRRPNWANRTALAGIHVCALAVFWPGFFSWSALAVAAFLAYVTGAIGVTLGYHRTLTHRSLRLRWGLEYVVATLGALAMQGAPIEWVATHRVHHAHSDHEGDPHTTRHGFTWAHVKWLLFQNRYVPTRRERAKHCPDLVKDPYYRVLSYLSIPLQVALGLALFAIGGWPWVVWGIFARLIFTYHTTWFVNSASHWAGYRTFRTGDRSTNSWWVALMSFGEGWHNNHHAFPFSARHGMAWFEIDVTWWHIKALQMLHLADRVRIPTKAMMERFALRPVFVQRSVRSIR